MILSVGLIPVRKNDGDWEFLLLRCFKYWDFPKGELEPGEEPLTVALRELQEETSLTQVELNWGEIFLETQPYSRGKIARYYLGEITQKTTVRLLPNPETGIIEHHEYRWVNYENALTLLNARVQKVLEWANQQIIH